MSLTEVQIRSAKAIAKSVKLSDGDGLFLLLNPNGSRWWRFRYRYGGKERGISLGVYPDVSLKLARARRNDARRMLVEGVDPSAHRQAGKLAQRVTLQLIAEEWLDIQAKKLAAVTLSKVRWMLTEFILPRLGGGRSTKSPLLRSASAFDRGLQRPASDSRRSEARPVGVRATRRAAQS